MIDSMEDDVYEGVKNNDRNLLEEFFEVRSKLFCTLPPANEFAGR